MRESLPLSVVLFMAVAVFLPSTVQSVAEIGGWNAFGPQGGYIRALERDPIDSKIVYLGVSNASAFKSVNAGESWARLSGLPSTVSAICFDPADAELIFVGGANGLYNSRDAGATWTEVGSGLSDQWVQSFVIPVSAQENMLAGTRNGVFRSTDGGETWVSANTGMDGTIILALASDPSTPDVIYAGTLSHGIYKTVDGGSNWTATDNGLSGGAVYCIVVDPVNSDRVYAGTWNGGVFVSENSGSSWAQAGSDLMGSYVPVLSIDPDSPYTVYAGTEGGLWTSDDHGASWVEQPIGQPFDIVSGIALGLSGRAGILAGTQGAGVFRATDGGLIWKESSDGMIASHIFSLAASETHPGTTYAGTRAGVYRSDDWGRSWVRASSGLETAHIYTIALDPFAPGNVYAATGRGVFRSGDGGGSWVEANTGMDPGPSILSLSVGGPSPGTILAGTETGVYRSTDGADSWSDSSSGLSGSRVRAVAQGLAGSNRAYAGTESEGVFRSDDGGLSWVAANTGLEGGAVRALVTDPLVPDAAYAAIGPKIFKTVDGGLNWARIDTGLSSWSYYCLAFDPTDPEVLYAASNYVFRSGDSGETWTTLGNWGNYPWVQSLAIDAADGRTVFAGSYGGGVRRMTLPGRALWIPVVTHAPGLNSSSWRSDVWVLNPEDEETTVALRFHSPGGLIEGSYSVAANSQLVFSDVVDVLGGGGSGALEIKSDSYIFAVSRTYNASGEGTFGQSYPAVDVTQTLSQGQSALLPQLAEETDFRTNIGVVNIGGDPATVSVELFDGFGALLANLAVPLQPGEWRLEVRPYFEEAGVSDLQGGWARVDVKGGDSVVALGSVIDNLSGDPTSILMARPPDSNAGDIWVPVVTHVPGLHQSQWRSNVALLNPFDESASLMLTYHGIDGPLTMQESIGSGVQEVLDDIVDAFGVSGSGALEVTSTQPMIVSSRTYNQSPEGTFGQSYPGVRPEAALNLEETGYLLGLAENEEFRTNIGFANPSTVAATVVLELFSGAGEMVGQYSLDLEPGEWRLEVQPFEAAADLTDLDQGFARVTLQSGEAVVALGSVVDNRTNDPTTVALVK